MSESLRDIRIVIRSIWVNLALFAGLITCAAVVLASGNDAHNLEAASKSWEINPNAEIHVRLYSTHLRLMMEKTSPPNMHFFSPYKSAAAAIVGGISCTDAGPVSPHDS